MQTHTEYPGCLLPVRGWVTSTLEVSGGGCSESAWFESADEAVLGRDFLGWSACISWRHLPCPQPGIRRPLNPHVCLLTSRTPKQGGREWAGYEHPHLAGLQQAGSQGWRQLIKPPEPHVTLVSTTRHCTGSTHKIKMTTGPLASPPWVGSLYSKVEARKSPI